MVAGKNESSAKGGNMTTRIGMMMGDPAGIGAELTARVLAGGPFELELRLHDLRMYTQGAQG